MLEHETEQVTETGDDWGDFGSFIQGLEQQETASTSVELTEVTTPETEEDNSESVGAFLEMAFVMVEEVTSVLSGVEFAFDEKGKTRVIEATQPVLNKHGDTLMGLFGQYVEEATLLIAVVLLAWTSRKQLEALKHQGGDHEKAESTNAA